jgi:hypothetical protein
MALDSSRTINGTFGEVWHDGAWMTNVRQAEAVVTISKEEIKRAGTRWTGHKQMNVKGTGSIVGYKITSEWAKRIGSIAEDRGKAFITELIFKLDDPDAFGAERIRLKGVQFDEIPLMRYEVDAIVDEELKFTFEGYEFLDEIVA